MGLDSWILTFMKRWISINYNHGTVRLEIYYVLIKFNGNRLNY